MSKRQYRKRAVRVLPTIWTAPDTLWERVGPILTEMHPPAQTGRPRQNWRRIFDGIIYQLRTGCQWNHLPRVFGPDSTVHRWFTLWCKSGALEAIWSALALECDELNEVYWKWQSADGCLGKARMGGDEVGPNPTDRAKKGSKKSLLVDQEGGPLSVVVTRANVNDAKCLEETLERIVIDRPEQDPCEPEHLCLDAGYKNPSGENAAAQAGYVPHIRPLPPRKNQKLQKKAS